MQTRDQIQFNLNFQYFVNDTVGWVVGDFYPYNAEIYKTVDGGENWIEQNNPGNLRGWDNSIKFIDANHGWICGDGGKIMYTSDGGSTWVEQISGTSLSLNSLYFVNLTKGWVTGEAGTILHTTDAGNNWIPQGGGTSQDLHSVFFLNDNIGWIVGSNGTVLKTANGGNSWSTKSIGTDTILRSVFFIDENKGWMAGYIGGYPTNGLICRTTDGGNSWISQGVDGRQFSIFFVNPDVGWVAGFEFGEGNIRRTDDGGLTWYFQSNPSRANLRSIKFMDSTTGWAVGDYGQILKTTNGGIPTAIKDNNISEDLLPQEFRLLQNYPNPFNPSTTITYKIPHSGVVKLKVFDVLGREVETLVNSYQVANKYSVVFNASKYPSGIYFYTLRTNNWAETKKMLLIR